MTTWGNGHNLHPPPATQPASAAINAEFRQLVISFYLLLIVLIAGIGIGVCIAWVISS